ncbi:MAG: HEAT repeat domain-containing protein [Deltaproteobacteria bacterium]
MKGLMVRFFCPRCWADFAKDFARCPKCGLNIPAFLESKDYVDRLILALGHPEKGTPVRAAWILGQLRRPEAVEALIESIRTTRDVYLARAAVKALGKIGTPEAIEFLKTLGRHPARTVSEEAVRILRDCRF